MKRTTTWIVALAASSGLALVGCGGSTGTATAPGQAKPADATPTDAKAAEGKAKGAPKAGETAATMKKFTCQCGKEKEVAATADPPSC